MDEIIMSVALVLSILLLVQPSNTFRLKKANDVPHEETNSIEGAGLPLYDTENLPEPEVVMATEGGQLVLSCEAGGSPSPTIHWLLNRVRLEQNDNNRIEDEEAFFENNQHNKGMPTLRIGSTKSRLFIDCVTQKHNGEFACVADEPTRRITKITKVRVVSSFGDDDVLLPCLDKRHEKVATPARIYMWTAHRLEIEGADVQLFCRAEGSPRPAISWVQMDKQDNMLPLESDQYQILANGDLLIREISFDNNMGTYKCIAENANGKDEADSFLYPTSFGKK